MKILLSPALSTLDAFDAMSHLPASFGFEVTIAKGRLLYAYYRCVMPMQNRSGPFRLQRWLVLSNLQQLNEADIQTRIRSYPLLVLLFPRPVSDSGYVAVAE